MFTLKNIVHNNNLLNHIHISNDTISCKLFPNLGASIQTLSINNIDILNGIDISKKGLDSYKEKYQSALLFPYVGRIQNGKYHYNNADHHLTINDKFHLNALHGLVYDKSFQVNNFELSEKEAIVQLAYESDSTLIGFPFEFKLQITYQISDEKLQLKFKIENRDTISLPFGLGWHPYFKTEELNSNLISFHSVNKYVCDENLIPIETRSFNEKTTFKILNKSFDDTFILLKNEVKFKTDKYLAQMKFSGSHENYLQIYTPEDRKSIALEPITCIPNALNNRVGLREVQPNEAFEWSIELKLSIDV
jgi:aldose 1-epimerase